MKWRWPMKTALFNALTEDAISKEGGTYRISSVPYEYAAVKGAREYGAESVDSGYAVGVIRGPIIKKVELEPPSCYTLGGLLKAWHDKYDKELYQAGRAIGLWYHEGCWHIDCVEIIFSEHYALELARKNREKAIYCLATGKAIFLEESE